MTASQRGGAVEADSSSVAARLLFQNPDDAVYLRWSGRRLVPRSD
jgi:hypothetical protein